jgi:hypothetical protein
MDFLIIIKDTPIAFLPVHFKGKKTLQYRKKRIGSIQATPNFHHACVTGSFLEKNPLYPVTCTTGRRNIHSMARSG